MKLFKILISTLFMNILCLPAYSACLTSQSASEHIGEKQCVCGNVASTHYASNKNSQPTFLNLDMPYPNQIFTVVIFGENRTKFGQPEIAFRGKSICVSGEIGTYKGKSEIIVVDPSQIK